MSLDKATTGKMEIKLEKVNNVMTKDEFVLSGELSEQHKVLVNKARESAYSTLKAVKDGDMRIEFKASIEI